MNSGLFSVIVSGGILRVPFSRCLMYSFSAWIDSYPMKVLAVVLTFWVMMVIGMKSSPRSRASDMSP